MFGLKELKKGYFLYAFCTPENLEYVGPYPAEKFYNPEHMRGKLPGDIKTFKSWYNKNKGEHFDMQKEMLEYCQSDVIIIKQACLHFRNNFINHTGMDPFQSNVTISQLCMDYFKSTHLERETLAIIPPNGYYNNERQSESGSNILNNAKV